MKKNYRAKLQGEFDIVQLTKNNYDEVVAFIQQADKDVVFDRDYCSRATPYIEFLPSNGGELQCVELGDYVFTDKEGVLRIMSKRRFESTYEEV